MFRASRRCQHYSNPRYPDGLELASFIPPRDDNSDDDDKWIDPVGSESAHDMRNIFDVDDDEH